jgi:ribonuclease R
VRYAVGARLRVQVSRVDLDGRRIDFRLVREGDNTATTQRTPRERSAAAASSAENDLAAVKDADRVARRAARQASAPAKGKGMGRAAKAAKSTRAGSAGKSDKGGAPSAVTTRPADGDASAMQDRAASGRGKGGAVKPGRSSRKSRVVKR